MLKQPQGEGYSFVDETILLFLLQENLLNHVETQNVYAYIQNFVSYVKSVHHNVYTSIEISKDLSSKDSESLRAAAAEFNKVFVTKSTINS